MHLLPCSIHPHLLPTLKLSLFPSLNQSLILAALPGLPILRSAVGAMPGTGDHQRPRSVIRLAKRRGVECSNWGRGRMMRRLVRAGRRKSLLSEESSTSIYLHCLHTPTDLMCKPGTERLHLPTLSFPTLVSAGNPLNPVPPVNSPPLPIGPAVKRMTEVPILNPEQVTTTSATYPCNPPFQSTQSAPMVWAWIWAAEKAVV